MMLALCKVRDASPLTSERLTFLMQCAEKEDKKWEREESKGKIPTARNQMGKASGTKGCCSCVFKECQWAGCKCNIRSKVFLIVAIIIIIMKNTVMYLFSKNKLIHSLQFDINIVDLTCIYSPPPPPHTSLLIYSISAGSIRVLLSQCTLSKLFYLFKLF